MKPGGYLVIYGSNFNFHETAVAGQFAPAAFQPPPKSSPPAFGPDNRLRPGAIHTEAIFRKLG